MFILKCYTQTHRMSWTQNNANMWIQIFYTQACNFPQKFFIEQVMEIEILQLHYIISSQHSIMKKKGIQIYVYVVLV